MLVACVEAASLADEKASLDLLFNALSGPSWTNSTGWGGADPCWYYGVTCSNQTTDGLVHVWEINLDRNEVEGVVPDDPSYWNFPELNVLKVRDTPLPHPSPTLHTHTLHTPSPPVTHTPFSHPLFSHTLTFTPSTSPLFPLSFIPKQNSTFKSLVFFWGGNTRHFGNFMLMFAFFFRASLG